MRLLRLAIARWIRGTGLADPQGIELYALCAKKENKLDGAARREVRDEMVAEQFQAQATRYLKELRRGAMIEVK